MASCAAAVAPGHLRVAFPHNLIAAQAAADAAQREKEQQQESGGGGDGDSDEVSVPPPVAAALGEGHRPIVDSGGGDGVAGPPAHMPQEGESEDGEDELMDEAAKQAEFKRLRDLMQVGARWALAQPLMLTLWLARLRF